MSLTVPGNLPDNRTVLEAAGSPVLPSSGGPLPAADITPSRKAWVENVSILLRHKMLILAVVTLTVVGTGIYAFTQLPDLYTATSVILPARKAGGSFDNVASGIASSLKDLGMTKLGSTEDSYSAISLMQSRELQEKIVKQFGFQRIYKCASLDDALNEFSKHLSGDLSRELNFTISFEDPDPARAAKVVNAVVDAINDVNSNLAIEEAKHNVTFVEQRYKKNVEDLDSAEHALAVFQKKYGVYSLPDQAKAEVAALASLEQEKSAAEIGLHNAEQIYGANASEATVYKNTIQGLSGKLAQMQAGLDAQASSFLPAGVLSDAALDYLRLMRDVEIQSKLKAFLLPAYEQAKLDQNKDMLGFLVLDHASAPSHKSGPHRSIILLEALVGSFLAASTIVLLIANIREMRRRFQRDRAQLGLQ